jgi:hypothetical protein
MTVFLIKLKTTKQHKHVVGASTHTNTRSSRVPLIILILQPAYCYYIVNDERGESNLIYAVSIHENIVEKHVGAWLQSHNNMQIPHNIF